MGCVPRVSVRCAVVQMVCAAAAPPRHPSEEVGQPLEVDEVQQPLLAVLEEDLKEIFQYD